MSYFSNQDLESAEMILDWDSVIENDDPGLSGGQGGKNEG